MIVIVPRCNITRLNKVRDRHEQDKRRYEQNGNVESRFLEHLEGCLAPSDTGSEFICPDEWQLSLHHYAKFDCGLKSTTNEKPVSDFSPFLGT